MSYSGDLVASPANEGHTGNNITSYQPRYFLNGTKRIYLTEYQKRKMLPWLIFVIDFI